jgi:bifunctional non-homologous end joining protein LigD
MRPLRIPEPFNHPEFIFEPKLDGFRALAHVESGLCTLVSRNDYVFTAWPALCSELAQALRGRSAVLDGEICCLDPDGGTQFNRLLFRREAPWFYAFDLLGLDGRDLRGLPLLDRKARLARILPEGGSRVLFLDGIMERGCDLFREICARDLEGVVGKWAHGCSQPDGSRTSWVKIKNPAYSQTIGRANSSRTLSSAATARRRLARHNCNSPDQRSPLSP